MKNRAFTLIEVLVVVLIIGILAAIALPQYQRAVAKSHFSNLKLMVNSIEKAQEAYYLAHDDYSDNFNNLDITMPNGLQSDVMDHTQSINRIEYDWGYCQTTNYHVICSNTAIGMNLDHYYAQAKYSPGKKVCTVGRTTDLSDYRNEICKQETGAESGSPSTNYNVIFWTYE